MPDNKTSTINIIAKQKAQMKMVKHKKNTHYFT